MLYKTENIYIKFLLPEDITDRYVNWMNDSSVVRYTESRFQEYDMEDLVDFTNKMNKDTSTAFFGVFELSSNLHIGNIRIKDICSIHKRGEVGLIIGDKSKWGYGYATEAIKLVADYAFKSLDLNKLFATCYEPNIGSLKAFLKNNWEIEGRLKKHVFVDKDFCDLIYIGLQKLEWLKNNTDKI